MPEKKKVAWTQQHKQGPSPNLLQVWGHWDPTACALWGPLVMNEKTENGETCLRLKQGYTETGP